MEVQIDKYEYETNIEAFFRKLKISIFKSYYMIVSHQFHMNLFYILLLMLEFFQIIGIIIPNMTYFQITQSNEYLTIFKNIILLGIANSLNANITILYICTILFIIQLILLIIYYSKELKSNHEEPLYIFLLFRFILFINMLYQTVFTIPILSNLFSFFQTDSNGIFLIYNTNNFNSVWNYINLAICCINIILFLIICVLNNLFLNDNRALTLLAWACPKYYIRNVKTIFKLILTLFFVFNFYSPYQDIIKRIFALICITTICILRLIHPIGYHSKVNVFCTFFEGCIMGNCLICIVNQELFATYTITSLIIIFSFITLFGLMFLFIAMKIQSNIISQKVN